MKTQAARPQKSFPWWPFALGMLLAISTSFASLILMSISGAFITAMSLAGLSGLHINYFTPAALIRALAIFRTAGRYGERLLTHEAILGLLAWLRVKIFQNWAHKPLSQLAYTRSSLIQNRMNRQIEHLENWYLNGLIPATTAFLVSMVIPIGLMIGEPYDVPANWWLITAVGMMLMWLPGLIQTPELFNILKRQERALFQFQDDWLHWLRGKAQWQVLGLSANHFQKMTQSMDELYSAQNQLSRKQALLDSLNLLWMPVTVWIALYVFSCTPHFETVKTDPVWQPGIQVGFLFLIMASFEPLMLINQSVISSLSALLGWQANQGKKNETGLELAKRSHQESIQQNFLSDQQGSRVDLHCRQLGFCHNVHENCLKNLTLDLPYGTHLVLWGPSGIGKSTFAGLLTGLYTPQSGEITINQTVLNDQTDRSHWISVADQNAYLINDTLLENLRLGNPDASEPEIWAILEVVGLQKDIQAMPDQLLTWLGESGTRLSGGQAKRLSVARALLRKTALTILDEPTEGLDQENALAMLARIRQFLSGKSLIWITHQILEIKQFEKHYHLQ